MTTAQPKDYWISPNALYIELNALGNPDYIQANCVSGAQILVYVKDIIGYDAGHNYQRWSLQASPTVFNTHTAKYVYAAIPRPVPSSEAVPQSNALIVFPSEIIDIYGKNAAEEQIGSEDYYYINLGGIITSSGDNGTTNRNWQSRVNTGLLSSDEAIAAGPNDSEWYQYSTVEQVVTFLKNLTMKVNTLFINLFAHKLAIKSYGEEKGSITFENGGSITGVADKNSASTSKDTIVTPAYANPRYLSKQQDDTTAGSVTSKKGFYTDGFVSGQFGSGAGMFKKEDGTHIETDYLDVRRSAYFRMLTISEVKHIGGEMVLSAAACQFSEVEETISHGDVPVFRCYFDREVNGKVVFNEWEVGDLAYCATFHPKEGTSEDVRNHWYWRKVDKVHNGQEGDEDDRHYIDFRNVEGAEGIQYAAGSGVPAVNDNVVLLGSMKKGYRQTAQIYSTVEVNAPSRKYYAGIDRFSLEGKAVETLEWDSATSSPHWNIGGNGDNSIDFKEGKLKIVVGGNNIEETLDEKFNTYIEDQYNALRDSAGNIIEVMTPNDAPWLPSYGLSDEELAEMVGSFLLTKDGVAYKFIIHSGRYVWQAVDDVYLIQALNEAKKNSTWVQEFENGRYKNFVKSYNEEAGVVVTSQFAGLLAQSEVGGIPISAAMGVFTRDGESGAYIKASKIDLSGKDIKIVTDNFKVNEKGNGAVEVKGNITANMMMQKMARMRNNDDVFLGIDFITNPASLYEISGRNGDIAFLPNPAVYAGTEIILLYQPMTGASASTRIYSNALDVTLRNYITAFALNSAKGVVNIRLYSMTLRGTCRLVALDLGDNHGTWVIESHTGIIEGVGSTRDSNLRSITLYPDGTFVEGDIVSVL